MAEAATKAVIRTQIIAIDCSNLVQRHSVVEIFKTVIVRVNSQTCEPVTKTKISFKFKFKLKVRKQFFLVIKFIIPNFNSNFNWAWILSHIIS